jgi:hypothetical protein
MILRSLCAAFIVVCAASPAAADLNMDLQCDTTGKTMQTVAKQCSASGGVIASAETLKCLGTHASDFSQTATTCVNAAESHYEAASKLTGRDADRELTAAATFLGLAAEANIFLANRALAKAQLDTVVKLTSQVTADPHAGEVAGLAQSELAVAHKLLAALNANPQ